MGMKTGDKSRYNRERRKKIAQRAKMRVLRAELSAAAAASSAKTTSAAKA